MKEMYGMTRILLRHECNRLLRGLLSKYLNSGSRGAIICHLHKPLCNDFQFNRALLFVSEMCLLLT